MISCNILLGSKNIAYAKLFIFLVIRTPCSTISINSGVVKVYRK